MEQEFLLKRYGKFDLFELAHMNAEERSWHIQRITKENQRIEEDAKKNKK